MASALLCSALLAGCGGTDEPTAEETVDPTPTSTAPSPTPTPTPKPSRTPKPTPTATPTSDQIGDGDDVDDDRPATAGGGVCGELDAVDVSARVMVELTGAALGGGPGCQFTAADKRSLVVTVIDRSSKQAGGMAGAKNEATSTVEGEPQDVAGAGSAAFVVTGTVFGGAEIQGAGAVQVGDRIVSVTFTQHQELGRAVVKSRVYALLQLIADELD